MESTVQWITLGNQHLALQMNSGIESNVIKSIKDLKTQLLLCVEIDLDRIKALSHDIESQFIAFGRIQSATYLLKYANLFDENSSTSTIVKYIENHCIVPDVVRESICATLKS